MGISSTSQPWEPASSLPLFLRERYQVYRIDILAGAYLLVVDPGEEQTPAAVRKHLDLIRGKGALEPIYVRQAITAPHRSRLVEYKIPFTVPGNQMYLPLLGIDFRSHLTRWRSKRPAFSPSAQAAILALLLHRVDCPATLSALAKGLGYSAMTMSRVLDELESAGLIVPTTVKRERLLNLERSGLALWEKVMPHLSTPVRRRFVVTPPPRQGSGSLAGESALARYSMLSEPEVPVMAFARDEWKQQLKDHESTELSYIEPGSCQIELWKYPPALLSREGLVDRLSLYLSLRDHQDERIQAALQTLLGEMEW